MRRRIFKNMNESSKRIGIRLGTILCLLTLISSCLSSQSGGKKRSSAGVANTPDTVSPGYGRYLTDSITGISGNFNLDSNTDLSNYLTEAPKFISNNNFLKNDCTGKTTTITDCYKVIKAENSSILEFADRRFAYPVTTEEFLQIQAFGNSRDITDKFLNTQAFSFDLGIGLPYVTSFPSGMYSSSHNAFYLRGRNLTIWANSGIENNASYSPSNNVVSLGFMSGAPNVFVAEDPTVTYHEFGHHFNKVALNSRTISSSINSTSPLTDLGYMSYDEAGSIGEGLADYYSYFMNSREDFGDWALKFVNRARPLTEASSIHSTTVSETFNGRLLYPEYLTYEPNEPELIIEDVHNSGTIISHFLVAITKSISSTCNYSTDVSKNMVIHLVLESFGELGDLSAKGYDSAIESTVNHSQASAFDWVSKVNPINYRSFIQTFSKYFYRTLGDSSQALCAGGAYNMDQYEVLVDSYGLLLFKTYNLDGNGLITGHLGPLKTVTATNRIKSTLIKKQFLKIDPRENASPFIIVDDRANMKATIDSLIDNGRITGWSTLFDDDLSYNNGNNKVSPGEIVAIIPNLYNDSNSTMGGVQVLANDWDHTKGSKPCNIFEDLWPLSSEGAADLSAGEGVQGGCNYVTRYNGTNAGLESLETNSPVCFAQTTVNNVTQWVTQDVLKSQMGLEEDKCLDPDNNSRDCFVRFIKGADHAFYSKINSKETWFESIGQGESPEIKDSNTLIMEASPWISPGTRFRCRMRARFTNCEECWHDANNSNDNYKDYEFSGPTPFKIFQIEFQVVN